MREETLSCTLVLNMHVDLPEANEAPPDERNLSLPTQQAAADLSTEHGHVTGSEIFKSKHHASEKSFFNRVD